MIQIHRYNCITITLKTSGTRVAYFVTLSTKIRTSFPTLYFHHHKHKRKYKPIWYEFML